jgi:hypothetical protein
MPGQRPSSFHLSFHLCPLSRSRAGRIPHWGRFAGATTKNCMEAYKADSSSLLFAPFNHPSGRADVPTAYLEVCGMDPLHEHALIYERVLREEYGIDTKLDLYPGYGYTFWTNWTEMDMSRKFVNDTLAGARWLLLARKAGLVSNGVLEKEGQAKSQRLLLFGQYVARWQINGCFP